MSNEQCSQFHFQYRCLMTDGHDGAHHTRGDDGSQYVWSDLIVGQEVANKTWRRGFVHLTVDANGLVSLWDEDHDLIGHASYLKLQLTPDQVTLIEKARRKLGVTP